MSVSVRYFASLREAVGTSQESFDQWPEGVLTIDDLRAWLSARGEPWASGFAAQKALRCAVDQIMVHEGSTPLAQAREVAFFPPVTGG